MKTTRKYIINEAKRLGAKHVAFNIYTYENYILENVKENETHLYSTNSIGCNARIDYITYKDGSKDIICFY